MFVHYSKSLYLVQMNKSYLLLGSNRGNSESILKEACIELDRSAGKIIRRSAIYRTDAWGFEGRYFLNQAVLIQTNLSAIALMDCCHLIEEKYGRERDATVRWTSRTLDIDILLFNDEIIKKDDLHIPHKKLQYRQFALTPLSEIGADEIHPLLGVCIHELSKICEDTSKVELLK